MSAVLARLLPSEAAVLPSDGRLSAAVLDEVARVGLDVLLRRLDYAACGSAWSARAVRGQAPGFSATASVLELLGERSTIAYRLDADADRARWKLPPELGGGVAEEAGAAAQPAQPAEARVPCGPGLEPTWDAALLLLRDVLDPEEVDAWFRHAGLLQIDASSATVATGGGEAAGYYVEWVTTHYLRELEAVLGVPSVVVIKCPS